jgi:CubicO group peptidase (beta-lactamase class C family)
MFLNDVAIFRKRKKKEVKMKFVRSIFLIVLLIFSFIENTNCETIKKEEGGAKMIFPEKEWKRGNPEDFGFTQETLKLIDEKMKAASADGVLIRNGYLVAEWNYAGPAYSKVREGIQSCTKSITSMMLGLAIQDGLIPSIDVPVKKYWPDFETGPYTDKITFRHLVSMTSGMATVRNWGLEYVNPGNIEPGKEYHYHNDQPVALAKALTYLYNRSLEDVLKEKILIHLQTDMKWGLDGNITVSNGNEVPLVHGLGASQWTAEGLARVGHLYLNNGRWKDKQLLDEAYVKESFTDIPLKINIWRTGKWQQQQPQTEEGLSKTGYGLGWWTDRGRDIEVWAMGGHGGQFCLVMPEYGVVMTKVNDWRKKPFISRGAFTPILLGSLKSEDKK